MSDQPPRQTRQQPPQPDPDTQAEQRAHERVKVNREFKNIDAFLSEYVADISHGGVFIRSKNPLEIGTRVELRFTIIIDDVETIEGEGEVVRTVREGDGGTPGMGVSFARLTPASERVIERLIARRDALERSIVVVEDSGASGESLPIETLDPIDDGEA